MGWQTRKGLCSRCRRQMIALRLSLTLLWRLLVAGLGKASAAAVPRRNPVCLLVVSSADSACYCWCWRWCWHRPHHARLMDSVVAAVAVFLVPAAAGAVLVRHALLLQQSLPSMRPLVVAASAFLWHPSPRRDSCPIYLASSHAVSSARSG